MTNVPGPRAALLRRHQACRRDQVGACRRDDRHGHEHLQLQRRGDRRVPGRPGLVPDPETIIADYQREVSELRQRTQSKKTRRRARNRRRPRDSDQLPCRRLSGRPLAARSAGFFRPSESEAVAAAFMCCTTGSDQGAVTESEHDPLGELLRAPVPPAETAAEKWSADRARRTRSAEASP